MKKVLMMHSQMSMYGGAELLVVRLARYLQEHNNKVTIATLASKDIDAYKGLEIITPQHQIEYRLRGSLSALKDVYEMWRELSNLCYKLVLGVCLLTRKLFGCVTKFPTSSITATYHH